MLNYVDGSSMFKVCLRFHQKTSIAMEIEYTWIFCQDKNCRQFRLLTWTSLIRQFVHSVNEERGFGKGVILSIVI